MSSGTLKLTNNSATVTGTGTAFKTDLATGDFIVVTAGGVTYTLGIKTIDSDTQVTLVRLYDGPAAENLAWQVIPRNVMVSITAQTHADVAQAMRGLLLDKKNWQAVFSDSDSITVTLPDGTSYSGPSWLKIAALAEASDISKIEPIATQVKTDAAQVATDKTAAAASAEHAHEEAQTAVDSASAAKVSETNAAASEKNAATSETNAKSSETAAAVSAGKAETAAAGVENPVSYAAQSLTAEQQKQARKNVGLTDLSTASDVDAVSASKGGTFKEDVTFEKSAIAKLVHATTVFSAAGQGNYLPPSQGAYFSWNRASGSGTTDLINHKGGGSGGFAFWNGDETTQTKLAGVDASGNLSIAGIASVVNEVNSQVGHAGAVDDGDYLNGGLLRSFILGRGANADTRGAYASLYLQEHVGTEHAAILDLNGYDKDINWLFKAGGQTVSPLGELQVNGSDIRLKRDFTSVSNGYRERIEKIGVVEFNYSTDRETDKRKRGFLAQQMGDIDDIYTFFAGRNTDDNGEVFDILNVNHTAVIADLVATVQGLLSEVDGLKQRVAALTKADAGS